MLVIGRLIVALVPLIIHGCFCTRTAEGTATVACLVSTIAILGGLCKILIIVTPNVIEGETFSAIWMITHLVH